MYPVCSIIIISSMLSKHKICSCNNVSYNKGNKYKFYSSFFSDDEWFFYWFIFFSKENRFNMTEVINIADISWRTWSRSTFVTGSCQKNLHLFWRENVFRVLDAHQDCKWSGLCKHTSRYESDLSKAFGKTFTEIEYWHLVY